ncbi:hypothetical protein ACW5XW_02875 [Aeromonas piscicola]|uniref:hypothetical protein n=1 Tax=Aeromonas piscicola TaxID=600645 RepID=UPI0005B4A04F|nr:hypothetical protein [Aeromonas piscicola]
MKHIKRLAVVLALAISVTGCAASYVRYEVSGQPGCAPVVVTDSAMGVSVRVQAKEIHCEKPQH